MSDDAEIDPAKPDRDPDAAADRSGHRLRGVLSRTARVARWEVARSTGTVDRKTVLLLVGMMLVVGVVGFGVADEGLGLEDEIYTVGIDEGNPYYDVAAASDRFRPVPLADVDRTGDELSVDVVLSGNRIGYGGDNGAAAYDAFRDAIDEYNEQLMAREEDRAAAYPVLVELEYQDRDLDPASEATGDSAGSRTSDGGGSTGDASGSDGGDSGAETVADDGRADGPALDRESGSDDLQVPNVGGAASGERTVSSPGSLSPPFPFESLVLAFLFVVPMNFVIQAYGSTIMDERVKRRGELLLVSPASRYEIVAGKTLPYLLGLVAVVAGITIAIDGTLGDAGPLSVLAAVPIALLFLAATFAGAMLARSFKELTFVTVTISVALTSYTFVPAIFTDITPIALISPLTLIVMDLQGDPVGVGEYLFSTGPFYCSAAVLFTLGVGLYREEDMFDQKAIPAKVIDAIAGQIDAVSSAIRGSWSPFVLSIVFIPFVFAGQLLAVALLFAVPDAIVLPVILVVAAAIEEAAKSIHVYAGFARSRFESSLRTAVVLGALSGLGFFVAEKFTHVVQLVGLRELTVGLAAFGPELSETGGPLVMVALFLAPLVLHVVTAVVSAVGASRGRTAYALGFVAATLVHAGYNAGVIALVA